MGGFIHTGVLFVTSLSAASALVGCALFEEAPEIDLAKNHVIYRPSAYRAPRRTQAPVFIARLKDRRELPNLERGENYRQVYADDEWDRPVPVMVEELVVEEIDRSGIYNGLSTGSGGKPAPTDIIVEPTLLRLYRMREYITKMGRRRTVAVASLQLRVRGPVDAVGTRPVLLDEVFHAEAATRPSLAKPDKGLVLAGRAFQQIMKAVLVKLYESNGAKSDADADIGAAPASVKRQADKKPGK